MRLVSSGDGDGACGDSRGHARVVSYRNTEVTFALPKESTQNVFRRTAFLAFWGCLETPRFRRELRRQPATAGPTDPFSLRVSDGRFWGASRHPVFVGSCAPTAANPFSLRVSDGVFGLIWGASRHPIFVVGSLIPYITPCRLLDA